MRIDKWLKVSRLIKRRSVAQLACDQGRVIVNSRPVKASYEVKIGDKVHLDLGIKVLTIEVKIVPTSAVSAQEANELYKP